jgi:hypothetical protein
MAAREFDRRRFGAALTAGCVALASAARAQIELGDDASRLAPKIYEPPTSLGAVLDMYKRMTSAVRVGGQGPFAFVVDTGANQSVISAELAAKLGLQLGESLPLNGVAGVQSTPTVSTQLRLGSRAARDVMLYVLPGEAIGGPGMLGLDQLDGARLTLDFQHETLTIDSGPELPGEGAAYHMKAHRRDGQLTLVDADLAGIPVTAFLDSGAQDTIGNMALRELALTRYPLTLLRRIPIVSVTGQTIDAEFADLPTFRIGGAHVESWPIAFADLHIFRLWNLVDRPAILIGVDVLSRFETVCLDFRHNEVRFRLPARA